MILSLLFVLSQAAEAPTTDDCQIYFQNRIRWIDSPSHFDTPAVLMNREATTALRISRADVEEEKDFILKNGYEIPRILEEQSALTIAPGALLSVRVQRVCCWPIFPYPRPCTFPDGE